MNKKSIQVYLFLIILLAVLAAVSIFMPQGTQISMGEMPASNTVVAIVNFFIMLIFYGGLGFLGLKLSKKIGFPGIYDRKVNNKERFLIPSFIGIGTGLLFIVLDLIFAKYNTVGLLEHPVFPTSIVASFTAGIGEEVLFRLFFISFWVWLISYKILHNKYQNNIFWIVSIFSAVAFTISHFPSMMFLLGVENIQSLPVVLIVELFLMNGLVSLLSAYYFRKYGFLAAVNIHFWTDIVWHVIWGLF